jgi:hypothetical protein
MNGTRCAMSSAMNATSRDSRSSLATTGGKCSSELRTPIKRIGTFAGLDLDEHAATGPERHAR